MAKPKAKDPRRVADYWTRKARTEKYPARSVFKLKETDEKYGLIRPGNVVLDLGSAPGSWLLYAARRVGPSGRIVGLDRSPLDIGLESNMRFLQTDVMELTVESLASEGPFDVVLSDLAPATTGNKSVDQARSLELALMAFDMACGLLKEGGGLLVKIIEGPDTDELFNRLRSAFKLVRRVKPRSSRRISPEIFGLGFGFIRKKQ